MHKKLKILLIEDSQADYLLIERLLIQHKISAELHCIDSNAELDAALQEPWDIVLSDFNVPKLDFGAMLARLKKNILTFR